MPLNADLFVGIAMPEKHVNLVRNGCLFVSVIAAVFVVPGLIFLGFVVWMFIYRGLGYAPPELQ